MLVADALEAAERVVDALALRIAVADEGSALDEDRALVGAVAEQATALGLEPLALDAQSLVWALEPDVAALSKLEDGVARAQAMGLGLLVARVRRRSVKALLVLGERERAMALMEVALAWARAEGALEEAARLEALAL